MFLPALLLEASVVGLEVCMCVYGRGLDTCIWVGATGVGYGAIVAMVGGITTF